MSLRADACAYAAMGWHVLPLRPGGKEPLGRLVPRGKDDASADLATVFRWWTAEPKANVGIVCGPSGIVALDVDPRNGGDDTLWRVERKLGALPETVHAVTGGGGEHFIFRHPGGELRGVLADGLDVKDHGYIVAPPSVHPSGGRYAWGIPPEEYEPADLPEPWVSAIRVPDAWKRRSPAQVVETDDPLRAIPATTYIPALTGRPVNRGGWACCPMHSGGREREPSLKADGTVWACYGCPPHPGKRVAGGNIYDLAGAMLGLPFPLRGADFSEVRARVARRMEAVRG